MDTNKIKDYQKFFENLFKPSTSQQQSQQLSKRQQQQQQQNNSKKKKKKNKKKKYANDPNFEQKVQSKVTDLYDYAFQLQQRGRFKKAYTYFRALSKIISTEPMVWLRMAECIIGNLNVHVTVAEPVEYTRGDEVRQCTDTLFVAPFKGTQVEKPEEVMEKISPEELTYRYADICMITCRTLLRDTDNEPLKRWAYGIHGFINVKRNNSKRAMRLFKRMIEISKFSPNFDPETLPRHLKRYAMISLIQYCFHCRKINKGLHLASRLKVVPPGPDRRDPCHSIVFNELIGWLLLGKIKESAQVADILLDTEEFIQSLALALEVYAIAGRTEEHEETFNQLVEQAKIGDLDEEGQENYYISLVVEDEFKGFKPFADHSFEYPQFPPNARTYIPDPEITKRGFDAEEWRELAEIVTEARRSFRSRMKTPDEPSGEADSVVEDEEDYEMDKPSTSKG